MLGYVGLCKAIERNVFHILANGEPLYDAYTTYLPGPGSVPLDKATRTLGRRLDGFIISYQYAE